MKILFVGDVNIGEYYLSFGHGPRTRIRRGDILEDVRGIFQDADIVAGNLEAPLTNYNYDKEKTDSSVLRGDPCHGRYLREAGFRVFQVANNHIVQHGREGFKESLATLESNDIVPVGISNEEVKKIDVDGVVVGFLAASDVPDNTDKNQTSYQVLDEGFLNRVQKSVNEVDHLFVMLHWGLESSTTPLDYQRRLIDEFKGFGVRGVIGSHPHLFYECWKENNFVAAPSLGNFVFDLCWDSRLTKSGILEVNITAETLEVSIYPVILSEEGSCPKISGPCKKVEGHVRIYELGDSMRFQQIKKVIYFLRKILVGDTKLKMKFIFQKVIRKIPSVFS